MQIYVVIFHSKMYKKTIRYTLPHQKQLIYLVPKTKENNDFTFCLYPLIIVSEF